MASRGVSSARKAPEPASGRYTGPDFDPVGTLDDGNEYTPKQVLEYYGDQGNLKNSQYDINSGAQPSWVVTNQIIHAIESNYPLTEYLSGFDAKIGNFAMRLFGPNFIKVVMKLVPTTKDSKPDPVSTKSE